MSSPLSLGVMRMTHPSEASRDTCLQNQVPLCDAQGAFRLGCPDSQPLGGSLSPKCAVFFTCAPESYSFLKPVLTSPTTLAFLIPLSSAATSISVMCSQSYQAHQGTQIVDKFRLCLGEGFRP